MLRNRLLLLPIVLLFHQPSSSHSLSRVSPVSMPKRKSYTRPGVEAAVHLLSLPLSSDRWNTALSHYQSMLNAKGGDSLVQLDEKRSALATKDNKGGINKDDLLNIVIPWKFAKGKTRNALKPLLQSNSDKSVEEFSMRAVELVTNTTSATKENERIKSAINELCNLKGVGPATASAILSIFHPDLFAFMDDEVIEALYDGKRGYTLKIYEAVNDKCAEICNELNNLKGDKVWNRYEVGKVLWTVSSLKAFGEEEALSELFGDDIDGQRKKRKK